MATEDVLPPKIRPPGQRPADYTPPTLEFLSGKWLVTHSTLPMWKSKRNVAITYKQLSSSDSEPVRLDDMVTYQTLNSDKIKSVHGEDKVCPGAQLDEWDWRGKDWLVKFVTSHWEVLGHGGREAGDQWAVTYFAKTIFTPAGIDIYARSASGLSAEIVEEIKRGIAGVDSAELKALADKLFEVKHDSVPSIS